MYEIPAITKTAITYALPNRLGLIAPSKNVSVSTLSDKYDNAVTNFTFLILPDKNVIAIIIITCAICMSELNAYTSSAVKPACKRKVCMIAPEQNIKPTL
jgi:hypothetical protein